MGKRQPLPGLCGQAPVHAGIGAVVACVAALQQRLALLLVRHYRGESSFQFRFISK